MLAQHHRARKDFISKKKKLFHVIETSKKQMKQEKFTKFNDDFFFISLSEVMRNTRDTRRIT